MSTNTTGGAVAQNEWDFAAIETPKSTNYLKMGNFILSIESGKFVKPEGVNREGQPKTPYLEITFAGNAGQITDKWFVTPKALGRLQYLHLMLTGRNCEKPFKSGDDVGAYYEAMCKSDKVKAKKLHMSVGGRQAEDGKIYGQLPYSDFICDPAIVEKIGWAEGSFEPGTANWERFLVKATKNISHTSNDVMLADVPGQSQVPNEGDSLPF